jgi:hypothetical protein
VEHALLWALWFLFSINYFRKKKKKQKEMKSPVFALFGVCSALFGAVQVMHAEVVEGEGDAQSRRLGSLRRPLPAAPA